MRTMLCLLLACAVSRTAEPDPKADVAGVVQPFVEKKPHLGVAVGVVTPKGSSFHGFGKVKLDGKEQTPDADTLYEIGSITKVFTGTILAQLLREGKIKLDDPVQPWLPAEWKLPRRDDRDITFLHLATHTSSLPPQPPFLMFSAIASGNPDDPYLKFDAGQVAKTFANMTLDLPIGSKQAYSNLGVGLLGHALAKAGGEKSYEALLRKRMLEPLGMKGTTIALTDEMKKKYAPGHDQKGKPASGWNFAALEACGGIRSGTADMLRFLEAAIGKEEALKADFAFAQQPWREMPLKGVTVGLCWVRTKGKDDLKIWHNGGTGGYRSYLGFIPEKNVGVVVLCNGAEEEVDELGIKILGKLGK